MTSNNRSNTPHHQLVALALDQWGSLETALAILTQAHKRDRALVNDLLPAYRLYLQTRAQLRATDRMLIAVRRAQQAQEAASMQGGTNAYL